MKNLIKKISIFIAIPLVLLIAIVTVNMVLVEKRISSIRRDYVCVLMGDSEVQRINPAYFKSATFNFASSGEHFYYTYLKLKKLLSANNPKTKIIVLGVSVHNFAPFYEKYIDFNTPEGSASLERYLYFMDLSDDDIIRFNNSILKRQFIKGMVYGPRFNGLFESAKHDPQKDIIQKEIDIHFGNPDKRDYSHRNQAYYFDKIIKLCQKKDLQILLISTPVHELYKMGIPDKYYSMFADILKRYPDIPHLNFLQSKASANLLSDGNHLNKEGSKIFSTRISDKVEALLKNEK